MKKIKTNQLIASSEESINSFAFKYVFQFEGIDLNLFIFCLICPLDS